MSRLRGRLVALRKVHPEGMIVVTLDYLQLIAAEPNETRRVELRERIGAAAGQCKALAMEFQIAIVIISSTARGNYHALSSGDAIESAGVDIQDGGDESFGPRKVVYNPDALVGMGKEAGEIESFADSVTVLLKWPTPYEGQRIVLSVVAKGRATGASWCALIFDHGTRFYPFQVNEMGDLPEAPKKTRGRPKTDESDDLARIDAALENDPTITSANKLFEALKAIDMGMNRGRVQELWRTHPSNPKNRDQNRDQAGTDDQDQKCLVPLVPPTDEQE